MNTVELDPFWEQEIYARGQHLNRYPFDAVVSFVYRNYPRQRPRSEVAILEVGCGAGNNLWFAAREGFHVAGIDGSASAIAHAQRRFSAEGLEADLRVGSFTELPWGEERFDLAIDRCSLTCVGRDQQHEAVAEVRRVLRPGGVFFFNGYSDQHTSAASGVALPDGRIDRIAAGSVVGAGALRFSSRADVTELFADGWEVEKLDHLQLDDLSTGQPTRHAEWRVVARKR